MKLYALDTQDLMIREIYSIGDAEDFEIAMYFDEDTGELFARGNLNQYWLHIYMEKPADLWTKAYSEATRVALKRFYELMNVNYKYLERKFKVWARADNNYEDAMNTVDDMLGRCHYVHSWHNGKEEYLEADIKERDELSFDNTWRLNGFLKNSYCNND